MSDRTQDEVVTLEELRAAAEAIPRVQPNIRTYMDRWANVQVVAHEQERSAREDFATADRAYQRARAEFWRLAYLWRGAEVSLYYRGDITDHDISDAEAIIAEVEART